MYFVQLWCVRTHKFNQDDLDMARYKDGGTCVVLLYILNWTHVL